MEKGMTLRMNFEVWMLEYQPATGLQYSVGGVGFGENRTLEGGKQQDINP